MFAEWSVKRAAKGRDAGGGSTGQPRKPNPHVLLRRPAAGCKTSVRLVR